MAVFVAPAINRYRQCRVSRITQIVDGTRIEPVRAIGDADALAEGIFACDRIGDGPTHSVWTWRDTGWRYDTPREAFHALWDTLHGPGAWDLNPSVVVIATPRVFLANIDRMRAA